MTITTLKAGETPITFAGIDKSEHKNLMSYLKSKNIKMRSVDVETNQQIDFGDDEDEQGEDEEEEKTTKGGEVLGKRVRKPVKDVQMLDEDYDSEEDESFQDEGSAPGSDEEDDDEEEFNEDDSDDVSMAESDLADEVKQLQKEAPKLQGKRGRRGDDKKEDEGDDDKKDSPKKKEKKKKSKKSKAE